MVIGGLFGYPLRETGLVGDLEDGLVRQLITDEIRRVVADCIANKRCLLTGRYAALIHRAYPNCGLSAADIGEQLLEAALSAKVPVKITKPEKLEFGKTG